MQVVARARPEHDRPVVARAVDDVRFVSVEDFRVPVGLPRSDDDDRVSSSQGGQIGHDGGHIIGGLQQDQTSLVAQHGTNTIDPISQITVGERSIAANERGVGRAARQDERPIRL